MTSAPVKGVGVLMNFVGGKNLTQTGSTDPVSSFGDVMSKTQSGAEKFDAQKQPAAIKSSKDTSIRDTYKNRNDAVKETKAADEAAKSPDQMEKASDAVEEAGNELVSEVAKKLGVSEEDVAKAMEELGLSAYSLFEPANLTQLVLTLSGNKDVSALLTDEGLFAKLQDLLQMAADAKDGLMQEMSLSADEMQLVLEKMQKAQSENEASQPMAEEEMAQEEGPQITVEVHTNGETVKLAADESGNAVKALETVSQETSKTAADEQETGRESSKEGKGQFDGSANSGNALIDALLQNKGEVQSTSAEPTGAFWSSQTQDIMNQIMDYMRIQLKPGMDQLEMQLHPESLGSVHVQLTNKGGEITAQFQVQNETVKAAIESQIMELKESLRDQGVKVEAVQVTVENHGFESNLWQGQGRQEDASSQNGKRAPRRINLNELDALFEEEASEEEILSAKMMEMNGNTVDYTA